MTPWKKDISRLIEIPGRGAVIVTLTRTGVSFRYPRKRFSVLQPYGNAMAAGERLSAVDALLEREQKKLTT